MKNSIPKYSVSRLACKAGLELVGRKWVIADFFLKVRIAKMRVGCIKGCKTGFEAFL